MLLARLTLDPVIPWSLPLLGLPAFFICAGLLVALTLGSYLLRTRMTLWRLVVLLALRVGALALAFMVVLRPAVAVRENDNTPSTLVIVLDRSLSMNNRDELDRSMSRWEFALRMLREAQPTLERLRQDHNVSVAFHTFAGDVADFDPNDPGTADGKRTDFSQMLQRLYDRNSSAGAMRGLIIVSDGADNGPGDPSPLKLAERWRNLPCKVHAIGCGDPASSENERDIVLSSIATDPPEVPIKNELVVKGTIDAYGFKGSSVHVQLFVNDDPKPKEVANVELKSETGNVVRLRCQAPDEPGEMKITLKVLPLEGELTHDNNQLTTYVTVTKEGVSVLFLDRSRFHEPQSIFFALENDERKRIRVHRYWISDEKPVVVDDYFQFKKEHYDVIFLGDVTLQQLRARDPMFLEHLKEQVEKNRTGLIWAGGPNGMGDVEWRDRNFEDLLPVDLKGLQRIEGRSFRLESTPEGWARTIMRLAPDREQNDDAWSKLRELEVGTVLGIPKPGAFILAQHPDKGPLFVGYDPGKGARGRVLVLGVDTTSRWIVDPPGNAAHRRFWQQLILWLAHQDEAQGDIWIDAPRRRLVSGDPFKFSAGLRDRTGERLKGGKFEAVVISPTGQHKVDLKDLEMGTSGAFTSTDDAGEYRMEVKGSGQDREGKPIPEKADAPPALVRFVVTPNTAETSRKAARPDFLRDLAKAGGGEFREVKDLPRFLHDLEQQPLRGTGTRARPVPDWKNNEHLSRFVPGVLLLFVALLSLEWFCRRKWDMV
jgi:hypothetical protein